jgi:DNA polymerase I-like protein with 3'-5' exonuclease and polymerase domains
MNWLFLLLAFVDSVQPFSFTMMRRTLAVTASRRGLFQYRKHPHIGRHAIQLRSAVSEAAAHSVMDDDEHDHNLDAMQKTIVNDLQQEHTPLQVSDKLSMPDYIACTVADASAPPVYVPPETETELFEGLKSRPVEGGNWNPAAPLQWSQTFGRRSAETAARLAPLVKLKAGDEGYFDVSNIKVPGVTIVRTKEQAQIVLQKLRDAPEGTFHACDTEVMDIDLKKVGPVGNGYTTCVSVYSGPDFDYGLGDGPGTALWIDNLDDSVGVLQEFKEWFEDAKHLKVWHNYGFDRHIMWNEGIDCLGFGGDTMHMARLQDTSRSKYGLGTGYGLEALTEDLLKRRKKPMKEIFGIKRLRKDGTEGLMADLPPIEQMQRDPQHRIKWIMYSAYDAEGTWLIRKKLQELLVEMPWVRGKNLYEYYQMNMCAFGEVLTDMERRGIRVDARDYLAGIEVQARKDRVRHLEIFRQWAATQIGPDGLALNTASSVQLCTFLFGGAENEKTKEPTESVRTFKVPREDISDFALEAYRMRDAEDTSDAPPDKDDFDLMTAVQLKALCKELGLKLSGKKLEVQERLRGHFLAQTQEDPQEDSAGTNNDFAAMSEEDLRYSAIARGLDSAGTRKQLVDRLRDDSAFALELLAATSPKDKNGYETISQALKAAVDRDGGTLKDILGEVREKANAAPKFVDVTITSIGMEPDKFTTGGAPSATSDVIRKLAGDPFSDEPKFGTAYDFFGGGDPGREACEALFSLSAIGSIDTMIANFLTSLQSLADEQSRVHGSVNLNTETGRLSSRRPNLQNQPALEKDTYRIRKAFEAVTGNNLIVCDYGQLELRLLASMTNCKSMIDAFSAGGDFHSRTALDMFDYVREKVDEGECLLEWDYSKGDPPKPMLKDMFASERRKAKTLNFSIAYGKTAHGLSQDWGVTKGEAEEMLQAWYSARPEVLKWQENTKKYARKHGITRTLMGRYRQLPDATGKNRKLLGHSERASINTPIQGGAADVAMIAMIKINSNEKLKRLGWVLLMQIHDEVILEGPEETAEEAFAEVINNMEAPWVFGLDKTAVPLLVDGSHVYKNWYDAK